MLSQEIIRNCLDICLNHKTTRPSLPVQKSEVPLLTSASKPERPTRKLLKIIIKCKTRKGKKGKKNIRETKWAERGRDDCRHAWGEAEKKS